MATAALAGYGTLIKKGDGATPENFTTIAEVLDINGPDLTLNTEDATNMSSTAGWVEHIATVLQAGDVTFDIQYVPSAATHGVTTGLLADMQAKTRRNWQLVIPALSPVTWAFAAFVTKCAPKFPVKGKITASITLRITSQPTLL